MAGLVIATAMLPGVYVVANAASFIEGKGLRLLGGLLDVGLLIASVYTVIYVESEMYVAVVGQKKRHVDDKSDTLDTVLFATAATGNYVAAKYLIGSPTSTVANLLVGAINIGIPIVILSNTKFY